MGSVGPQTIMSEVGAVNGRVKGVPPRAMTGRAAGSARGLEPAGRGEDT
jgi:hypothetical protein